MLYVTYLFRNFPNMVLSCYQDSFLPSAIRLASLLLWCLPQGSPHVTYTHKNKVLCFYMGYNLYIVIIDLCIISICYMCFLFSLHVQ